MKKSLSCGLLVMAALGGVAQEVIKCGGGSYASYTPWEKAKPANGSRGGDQSRFMQTRPLYLTPKEGEPLPTNDWWTRALVDRWTGKLWSYPALTVCDASGVTVSFPSYWIDNGTEMKAKSSLLVSAAGLAPETADVDGWSDFAVNIIQRDGARSMKTTLVHGSPFVWIETTGCTPGLAASGEAEVKREKRGSGQLYRIGDDAYGVWKGRSETGGWVAIGLLPRADDFETLEPYATAIIRDTRVDWRYDEKTATLTTTWNVKTEDLRGKVKDPVALQGFQPHHLKRTVPSFKTLDGLVWQTPRGKQRVVAGNSLAIDYAFPGMLPYWAAPAARGKEKDGKGRYDVTRMKHLLEVYVSEGGFGGDTYWGGKGLLQMAMAMMAARELGEERLYQRAHDKLRTQFENWLSWTPGEKNFYFSYVPRWGGLVGENTSYDSDTFNDHHFHYGYFTYSGALLCLVDEDFKEKYGPMLTLIAKDYANWDRTDKRFPLFRTFDPWAGHSFAGGMGGGDGNGQESSSEAMQGWGGLYLLGLALGDDAMRDAGIFGYVSEARGTAEYWFDRDRENIDYTKYKHPYNSNLTCHGVGWWTYFSGDPVWMHSIQWLPNTPALDYLSEDLKFAKWDWETMWKTKQVTGWEKELGDASLGNVLLSYLQRSDPKAAAEIFDTLAEGNRGVYKNADTAHLTYWATHSHLAWGELDFGVRADYPCARAYLKDGKRTLMAYNPDGKVRKVTFFDEGGKTVGTLDARPRQLTVSGERSVALAPLKDTKDLYEPPAYPPWEPGKLHLDMIKVPERFEAIVGEPIKLDFAAYDQYGDEMSTANIKVAVFAGPKGATIKKGMFTAKKPGEYMVRFGSGEARAECRVKVQTLEQVNLARLAKVTASSEENQGLLAKFAADGDMKTRWGSGHKNGEWIRFDFGRPRSVASAEIYWENARADHYKIEISNDGVEWKTAVDVPHAKDRREDVSWNPTPARYLRLVGVTRNTPYGVSIFEIDLRTIPADPLGM